MGTVTKRIGRTGEVSYQAKVRKNGVSQSDTFESKAKAQEWVTETEAKINKGQSVSIHEVRKVTLGDIFSDYLKVTKPSERKAGSLRRLKLEIGKIQLVQFNTKVLGSYLKLKLGQTIPQQANKKKEHPLYQGGMTEVDGKKVPKVYKPASVRQYYYNIRTALEWHAKEHEYMFNVKPFDDNPPPPAWEAPRNRRVEGNELERILDACDKMYVYKQAWKDLINFQIFSCMRIGETILMKWRDIFINEKEPHASYIFIPKENQKTKDKKKADDRYVSMRPELYALMKELMKRKGDPDERVFPYWKAANLVGRGFKTITKNATVEDMIVHDFRHEGISWLFENTSLTDIEIAKITGHTEMDTLMRYANLRPKATGAKLWAGLNA